MIFAPGFQVVYDEKQKKIAEEILATYEKAGVEPSETTALTAGKKDSRLDKQMIDSLVENDQLVRLNADHCIHADALKAAMQKLLEKLDQDKSITLAEYRDLIGTSRKYAIMILEYADHQKMTRLVGDERVKV